MPPVEVTHEPEIVEPVDLCLPDGRLDRAAVGWTRRPLHRSNLCGRWGRNKRWEYWCIMTPTHLVAITVSNLDYLALHDVWFLEYGGIEVSRSAIVPLARGTRFPERACDGQVRVSTRRLSIDIRHDVAGMHLSARAKDLAVDMVVHAPPDHESLGVVIPWSDELFQYTVKDNTRPAEGEVRTGGRTFRFDRDTAWACLDHGRGRWPYRTAWNWGSASGHLADGRTLGLQLGGRWTVGTGMTENALCVDGRIHKLGHELAWKYDPHDYKRPWRVHDHRVDVELVPFHERRNRVELVVLGTEVHQCFGHYRGSVVTDDGERLVIDGLLGWAEEARMRW